MATSRWIRVCPALGLLACAACLQPAEVVRLERPTRVAVAVITDEVHRKAVLPAPAALCERLDAALGARNLVPSHLPEAALQEFSRVRDTTRRLELLAAAVPEAEALLLVETQVVFYSQLAGSYRWTVYVRLSLAEPGAAAAALGQSLDLPVILTFAHQREAEALAAAGEALAARVGALCDDYFGGRLQPGRAIPLPAGAPAAPTTTRAASKTDAIYFVLVDRFANGDRANDGAVDPLDPAGWHGGDLQGVRAHLDELEALGVRSLWLSPVSLSRAADFHGHGAFHGYWVEDLGRVDPRFGGEAALAALVAEAHRRGMRVLLDWVVNHVGYDAPLTRERPDWFHRAGSIRRWDDPEELVRGEVHGLPDLAQEHPEVYAHLRDQARRWLVEHGVDGFRLDAVKHVGLEFWGRYNRELAALKPGLTLLGEHYDGSPRAVDEVWRRGAFTHMFDFPLAFALRDVFCAGRPAGLLGAVLADDRLYTDPLRLVTFVDNHDMPRVRTACGGDLERVTAALTAMLSLRGTPCLTYGTEAGLEGGEEPHNRGDMRFGAPEAAGLAARLRSLLALRAAHPALRQGATRSLAYADGVLAVLRALPDEAFLLLVNSAPGAREFSLPEGLGAGRAWDALGGGPCPGTLRLPAGGVGLVRLEPATPGAFAVHAAPPAARAVDIQVRGCSLRGGEELLVVGSPPELGGWRPAGGLGPLLARGADLEGRVSLPASQVYAYKLVVRGQDGRERWQEGENRFLFVPPGAGPLRLAIDCLQS